MVLYFTDTANGVNTKDPHFIPLVSRAQPYLVSKSNSRGNHGYQSEQPPLQPYRRSQKREEPHAPPRNTKESFHPEEESPFNIFRNTVVGENLHGDEERSPGPPLHSPEELSRKVRQPAFGIDSRPPTLTFPPTADQQIKAISPDFKFTNSFKDLENMLNDNNIENFFQMSNFNRNNKKLFSFPSTNQHDNFPNFASNNNDNNLFGNVNSLFGGPSQNQFQFSFPQSGKFDSGFNFPQTSGQVVGDKQNNPAQQNNYNLLNLFQNNSPFNLGNQQVPWDNTLNVNSLFPPANFGKSFNKGFKEFGTGFPPMFGINGRSTANSGNFGGFQGQRRNQFRVKDVPPPRRNGAQLRRHQPQNNYSPRQSNTENNYQRGIKLRQAPVPFPNYNTDENSQRRVPYANEPAKSFQGGGLKPQGQGQPDGGYIRGPTLLQTSIMDAKIAGIDGVSDLYDWLGSDEPLVRKFQK